MTKNNWDALGLKYNPFEPAASGAPVRPQLWIPNSWKNQINSLLDTIEGGSGVKALAIEGEYGSGKTYLLKWLEQEGFPQLRIRPFYFDNPGVQFYDLANNLLRQLGRYEFAKALWEYIKPDIGPLQSSYFDTKDSFITWLSRVKRTKKQDEAIKIIAQSLKAKDITHDDEIAFRFGMLIVDTLDKPYFEYRDFVAGRKNALVAEKEEANYFHAIIRALYLTSSVTGICFLLDEFEEVSLQKRLSHKESQDYLATLKRLLNVASQQDFWLVVSMTPQAAAISQQLEPALWQRFTGNGQYQFVIPSLQKKDAEDLLAFRLADAKNDPGTHRLWPFSPNIIDSLTPVTYSSPRHLVKVAFYVLTEALKQSIKTPISENFINSIEQKVYPNGAT
jgi:tetratricopeptide (TPR) repeat protein